MKIGQVRWLRMERLSTFSYITLQLPKVMQFSEACQWAEKQLPGWEVASGSPSDPDGPEPGETDVNDVLE